MATFSQPDGLQGLGLPPIDQVGFVVKSIEETRARYEPLFGPFTEIDGSVPEATYRGKVEDAQLQILFGHSGELEIEFIEWRGGHSPHREFIEKGREGMHHLRYRVENVDEWIEKLAPLGYSVIWYKQFSPEISFCYLEREGDPLLLEFLCMP